jgi:hypothetical protein
MTSDPGPGSDDFPLPPGSDGEPDTRPYEQPGPVANGPYNPVNGPFNPANGPFGGQPPYGQPAYGPPSYGPVPPYGPLPPYGQVPPYGQIPYGQLPYGQPGAVHPGMLTATADRERTMDVLKAAYGEGRITKDEFELRAGRAMSARTYAQLAAVVADLPAGPHLGIMPYQPGYYPAINTPTSGLAIGALVCGILEIFTLGFAAIPAVILGHLARTQIRQTGERGEGMAIAGLVLGYLGIGIWILIAITIAARGG